ncbi:hypothetical protein [Mucilaginibacter dorajii]|uniref:Uncharacterized protein n=1 Tax=Mucilaginibacter dorajii TaxID=692994 RepID=A0ABP7R529_9SPHI|nr:hypothetical protein [Mucilaginibacter dorajii]MCS3737775.1 mRNA-degrading endonuclease RelE of RelBE toxin-antitoxin system [Mucilaginibacter dorajii]
MSFKILPTPLFEKELKKLAKKYPSIKTDLKALVAELIAKWRCMWHIAGIG